MNLYAFNEFQLLLFFAALVRVGCLLVVMPIFNSALIPPTVKVLFSFCLGLILFPLVQGNVAVAPAAFDSTVGLILIVGREAMVGLCIGFVSRMFFESLAFGFSYMGMQMGFNMASAYDPHQEAQVPVIAQFITILATLLFLAADGHHMLLKAVAETFRIIPLGGGTAAHTLVGYVMDAAKDVFWIAVKLSAPMALMVFLVNCAFGIIAKAVPQINVLVVSFGVNVMLGLLVVMLTLPLLGVNSNEIFQLMFARMFGVMRHLHG